jgi:hypothetical protein
MGTNYQLALLTMLSLPYSRMAQERFTNLQKQGQPVPSIGSRLPKIDTGHKHMMFLSTGVLFTSYD